MRWVLIFISMFLIELPDKTSLATLSLVSKYGAGLVWLGSASAMVVQTVIGVSAGGLIGLIPGAVVHWLEIALFSGFAFWLWRESKSDEAAPAPLSAAALQKSTSRWRVVGQAFIVVFIAEFMDLTQIATMTYAARFSRHLLTLFIVVAVALVAANTLVAVGGGSLVKWVSARWIQRISAGIFCGLAMVEIGIQLFPGIL